MLSETIRTLCARSHISIAKLERELGFGNGTIRRWDVKYPSVYKALTVANYFGITVDELIRGNINAKNDSR